ncbi:hypothetical protein HYT84_04560 [Candidatus Micrarchaeota archaeon]|nr:hypothetical protein [Candidatus Micrarchaeota archaeon]
MEEEEKSGFIKLFGDYPAVRVIDFLITFREYDYPLTEIAENSNEHNPYIFSTLGQT